MTSCTGPALATCRVRRDDIQGLSAWVWLDDFQRQRAGRSVLLAEQIDWSCGLRLVALQIVQSCGGGMNEVVVGTARVAVITEIYQVTGDGQEKVRTPRSFITVFRSCPRCERCVGGPHSQSPACYRYPLRTHVAGCITYSGRGMKQNRLQKRCPKSQLESLSLRPEPSFWACCASDQNNPHSPEGHSIQASGR